MRSMANLCSQLEHVKQALTLEEKDFIGIFLYGSQNYRLDHAESDTDSIVVVKALKRPKYEFRVATGKIKVYALKYFLYRLKCCDLECLEILYTEYKILNTSYKILWDNFVKEFSKCVNYERIKRALCFKLFEHLDHILWMPKNKENARYNKKRLYWCIRVYNQLLRVNNGESFAASLMYKPLADYDLLKIKTVNNYLSIKDFTKIYKELVSFSRTVLRYSDNVSYEEDLCISNFYEKVLKI